MFSLFLAGSALAIILSATFWSAERKKTRALAKGKPVFVSEFNDNEFGKVIGVVSKGPTIVAPLSGRECVFYVITVEESKDDHWVRVHFEQEHTEFSLVDSTGRAVVKTKHIEAFLVNDHQKRSGMFKRVEATELAYLEKIRLSHTGLMGFVKGMRFKEHIIEIGERIAVMGHGSVYPDPNPPRPMRSEAYRGETQSYVVFDDHEVALTLSDQPSLIGRHKEPPQKLLSS